MNVEGNEWRSKRRAGDPHQCFHTARRWNAKTDWLLHEITNFLQPLAWRKRAQSIKLFVTSAVYEMLKCWKVRPSYSDFISCYDKQVKRLHCVSICKQYCVFLFLKHFWSSVRSLLCGSRLSRVTGTRTRFRCQGSRLVGWWEGWLVVFYSSDWSMRSCLRTLVWLVSLISPARNISSTTVYTLKCRRRKCIRGQEMRRLRQFRTKIEDKYHKPLVALFSPQGRVGFPGKLSYTMLSHHLACGHHYPAPPLSH